MFMSGSAGSFAKTSFFFFSTKILMNGQMFLTKFIASVGFCNRAATMDNFALHAYLHVPTLPFSPESPSFSSNLPVS